MPYCLKKTLLLVCCLVRVLSTSAASNGGFTFDLIRRDSAQSPTYNPSSTTYDRIQRAFDRSILRRTAFAAALTSVQSSTAGESIRSSIQSATGEYLMKIHLGTPPVEQLGIADTGSDLTWIQCVPCRRCYPQNFPLFNPRNSKTYRRISCKSKTCSVAAGLGSVSCAAKDRCGYELVYGDNSYTSGKLSEDTLTLTNASFPKIQFGCSHESTGTFADTGSGVIGLGGSVLSIIRQLNPTINGKFSYCLTYLTSNATSKISFGAADVSGLNSVRTPIVGKKPETYYHLTIEAMSVDNLRLEYKSNTTGLQSGNIIIDSGTTMTFLDAGFVGILEAEVRKLIKGEQTRDSKGMFGLCYKNPGNGELKVPRITAHFKGADVALPEGGAFVEIEKGVICLTIGKATDMAIFGNLHQMNYKVGFDLVKGEVSFLPTDCSKGQ